MSMSRRNRGWRITTAACGLALSRKRPLSSSFLPLRRRVVVRWANTDSTVAQIVSLLEEFRRVHHPPRLQFIVEAANVSKAPGNDVLADEVEREIFVPGGGDVLIHLERFVAIHDDGEMVVT